MENVNGATPSLRSYYRKVWNKATQLEEGKWRKRAIAEVVLAFLGLAVIGYALGFERVIAARMTAWLFIGIGLIAVGAWRFVMFLIRAPYQIHIEDQTALLKSEGERQEAIAEHDAALHAFDDETYRYFEGKIKVLPDEGQQWLRMLLVRDFVTGESTVWMLRDDGIVTSEGNGGKYYILPTYKPIVQRVLRECGLC